jgi:hypothetical protein
MGISVLITQSANVEHFGALIGGLILMGFGSTGMSTLPPLPLVYLDT